MTLMRIPLYLLAAAVLVALVVTAVCAWVGRCEERTYAEYAPPATWEEHPPP